jgi:hypothetical protein
LGVGKIEKSHALSHHHAYPQKRSKQQYSNKQQHGRKVKERGGAVRNGAIDHYLLSRGGTAL